MCASAAPVMHATWIAALVTLASEMPMRRSSAASRSSAAPTVAIAPGRASTVIENATSP